MMALFLIFNVLLAWTLSVLTNILWQNCQKRKQVKTGVLIELEEKKYGLALETFVLSEFNGTLDKSLIEWSSSIFKSYRGYYSEYHLSEQKATELLKLSDEDIAAYVAKRKSDGIRAKSIKKHELPFLENKLGEIIYFSPEIQRDLLEVRNQFHLLNQEIDESKYYLDKTHTPLDNYNMAIIQANLDNSYKHIEKRMRSLADRLIILVNKMNEESCFCDDFEKLLNSIAKSSKYLLSLVIEIFSYLKVLFARLLNIFDGSNNQSRMD